MRLHGTVDHDPGLQEWLKSQGVKGKLKYAYDKNDSVCLELDLPQTWYIQQVETFCRNFDEYLEQIC